MKSGRGFTVVELAIVIVVMAILLVIGTVSFRGYQASVRDKERESDIAAIQMYLESIYPQEIRDASGRVIKDAGTYPALMQDVRDGWDEWEVIFKDLSIDVLTPPDQPKKNMPSPPLGGTYLPTPLPTGVTCAAASNNCYFLHTAVAGSKDAYIYVPMFNSSKLCTKYISSKPGSLKKDTQDCRTYALIYKTENGTKRTVLGKHK